jgi:hypothetical protein
MLTHEVGGSAIAMVIQNYATEDNAAHAIRALEARGIGPEQIAVLARHSAQGDRIARETGAAPLKVVHDGRVAGSLLGGSAGVLVGFLAMVLPGMGVALGTATLVVTTLVGAGAGTVGGALLGAFGAIGVPEHKARRYAERFAAGDVIVVVDAGDRWREAEDVLVEDTGIEGDRR